jgi:hypothetical protein
MTNKGTFRLRRCTRSASTSDPARRSRGAANVARERRRNPQQLPAHVRPFTGGPHGVFKRRRPMTRFAPSRPLPSRPRLTVAWTVLAGTEFRDGRTHSCLFAPGLSVRGAGMRPGSSSRTSGDRDPCRRSCPRRSSDLPEPRRRSSSPDRGGLARELLAFADEVPRSSTDSPASGRPVPVEPWTVACPCD